MKDALNSFCNQSSINDEACNFKSREIIISDGDIEDEILRHSAENDCDLIVLGGHKNIFSKTSVGSTTKTVLKKAKIPVTVVPPNS